MRSVDHNPKEQAIEDLFLRADLNRSLFILFILIVVCNYCARWVGYGKLNGIAPAIKSVVGEYGLPG